MNNNIINNTSTLLPTNSSIDEEEAIMSAMLTEMLAYCNPAKAMPTSLREDIIWRAWTLITLTFVSLLFQLCVLPANYQLARSGRVAYLLLLQINLIDVIILLSQYLWIDLEAIIAARFELLTIPHAYFTKFFGQFTVRNFYILLALNRTCAILFPFSYQRVFKLRKVKFQCIFIWLLSFVYALVLNINPFARLYTCPVGLTFDSLVARFPAKFKFFYALNQYPLLLGTILPMIFYLIAIGKFMSEFLIKRFSTPVQPMNNGQENVENMNEQFLNLIRERTRLFFICLLGSIPQLIILLFSYLIVAFKLQNANGFTFAYQCVAIVFNAHQPLLMLALSQDMREQFLIGWKKMAVNIKINLNIITTTTNTT